MARSRKSLTAGESSRRFPHRIIRASAGTGKTFQLSNRFLGLLATGENSGRVLASTFTKKAAGEILDRVVLRLAEAALDDNKRDALATFLDLSSQELTRPRCLELVRDVARHLHRLRIGTLDSFFAQIARSYSLELGLPPGWQIVDELEDASLREEAMQWVVEQHEISDLRTLLNLLTKGEVDRGIGELLRSTVQELYGLFQETEPEAWSTIPRFSPLSRDDLATALETLRTAPLPGDKRAIAARDKDYQTAAIEDWDTFIDKGLANRVLRCETTYYNKPLPDELIAAYSTLIEHARAELVGRVAMQTEATFELLRRFHIRYQKLKLDRQALRFEDVTRRLAKLSTVVATDGGGVEQLGFRLDGRIDHLLLDEFQDTSPEQWQALEPFAHHVVSNPHGGSFFCVGDVKQAIYGWRGGVAEIFDAVSTSVSGLDQQSLTKSFRSSGVIIDTVNQVFRGVQSHSNLGRAAEAIQTWCSKFEEHSTAKQNLPGYAVLEVVPETNDDSTTLEPTLAYAARRVAELVAAAPGHSVGVLVRTNGSVRQLIFALRTVGVAASEEGGNPLTDAASVLLMLSVLRLADHPGDTVSRFHVATSPLGKFLGFTDHEDHSAADRFARDLRQELQEEGYGSAMQRWASALQGHCDAREWNRLCQLVDLAFDYQPRATLRVNDFIQFIEHQRVSDPSAAAVRVMTVHQSKGLEFDIVVLPELDKSITGQPPEFVVHRPTPTSRVDRVCRYVNENLRTLLPVPIQTMFEESTDRFVTESLCVLYVALTRAVHALHMIIAPSSPSEKLMPRTFAGMLRAALTDGAPVQPGQTSFIAGDPLWYQKIARDGAQHLVQAPPSPQPVTIVLAKSDTGRIRGLDRISPSGLEGGHEIRLNQLLRDASPLGRQFGTVIHALFAAINWSDESLPSPQAFRDIAVDTLNDIEQATLDVNDVLTKFDLMLANPVVRRATSKEQYWDPALPIWNENEFPVSGRSHLRWEVSNEHAFAVRREDQIMSGSIDRLTMAYDGDRLVAADILDFKTDTIDNESALNNKVEYYRPQLEAYQSAIQKLTGLKKNRISTRLLFVSSGVIRSPSQ